MAHEIEAPTAHQTDVELVPGGAARMIERSATVALVWTEWPVPPATVVRLRTAERPRGGEEEEVARVLSSELVELRPGQLPRYQSTLAFTRADP